MDKEEEPLETPRLHLEDFCSEVEVLINLMTEMNAVNEQASLEELSKSEEMLQAKDSAIRELEERLGAKVYDLESQLREKEGLLINHEAQLEMLKSEMGALVEEMTQLRRDKDRMSSESERLESELTEKKLLLAKAETEEWRSIGRRNLWRRRLGSLGIFIKGPIGKQQENNTAKKPEEKELSWSIDFTEEVEQKNYDLVTANSSYKTLATSSPSLNASEEVKLP